MYEWQKDMLRSMQNRIDETHEDMVWAEQQLKASFGSKRSTELVNSALANVIKAQVTLDLMSRLDFTPFLKGEENAD